MILLRNTVLTTLATPSNFFYFAGWLNLSLILLILTVVCICFYYYSCIFSWNPFSTSHIKLPNFLSEFSNVFSNASLESKKTQQDIENNINQHLDRLNNNSLEQINKLKNGNENIALHITNMEIQCKLLEKINESYTRVNHDQTENLESIINELKNTILYFQNTILNLDHTINTASSTNKKIDDTLETLQKSSQDMHKINKSINTMHWEKIIQKYESLIKQYSTQVSSYKSQLIHVINLLESQKNNKTNNNTI